MKNITILLVILLSGCSDLPTEDGRVIQHRTTMSGGYEIVTIDHCEYISYGHGLAHKGNCRHCLERRVP